MDFSSAKNLLERIRDDKEKRTYMNLGKLKQYLRIEEKQKLKGIKKQFKILYDKIMNHSKEINYSIKKFEHYILSYLILEIIEINKEYLNKNKLID